MDLRNGKLVIETVNDAAHILGGIEDTSFILSTDRRSKISRIPSELTQSETTSVISALGEKAADLSNEARAAGAVQTLVTIAQLGTLASAKHGSNVELVQQVTEALAPEEQTEPPR